jgi:hypothetical protein
LASGDATEAVATTAAGLRALLPPPPPPPPPQFGDVTVRCAQVTPVELKRL